MLAVISPAKKLGIGQARHDLPTFQPHFDPRVRQLAKVLKALPRGELKRLMKLSDQLADVNHQRHQSLRFPQTPDTAQPAVLTFTGDTYVGLEAQTLSTEDLSWAQDHLVILSGLYGALGPLDLIQPYRLEMGTRLTTEHGATLYDFWGRDLATRLNQLLDGARHRVVVNLASQEYVKAIDLKILEARLITPDFKIEKDGVLKAPGMVIKRARGMMARYMIENRLSDPQDLLAFRGGDYGYCAELSSPDRPVFIKRA